MKQRIFRFAILSLLALCLAALPAGAQRNGYSHLTAVEGPASVLSNANGRVDARLNLPLAQGDELSTGAGGRTEVELADGNRFQLAGESRVRLDALAGQEGSPASESSVNVLEGSLAAESLTGGESALRIDTSDVSVYLPAHSQARVNIEPARGTSVIVRRGSAEVQTRAGSTTVEEGSYLLIHGDEQPEVARGSFSRDRFDVWVAERTDSSLAAYNSASARYVEGSDYDQDVAVLDDYGKWDYSQTSQSEVWRPTVDEDWSPYTSGDWYSTPGGASWVSNEPWGWFPHHYGNWFFDSIFNSWCWSPAYVYSPAWVYWSYASSYVGWCPMGYYSYYAPYRGYWGNSFRRGLYISVNGIFNPAQIDFGRGWRFVGQNNFGNRFSRTDLFSGRAIAGRLGASVAVTSQRAIVPVSGRTGTASAGLRSYARTAPGLIARQSTSIRSAELTPYLARQRSLPPTTVRALTQENLARVDAASRFTNPSSARSLSGGRVASPEARQVTPREAWRTAPRAEARVFEPRSSIAPSSSPRNFQPRSDWRERPQSHVAPGQPRDFRGSGPAPRSEALPEEGWRSRYSAPPAQRVIEGIDRGHAIPPRSATSPQPRSQSQSRQFSPQRFESSPRNFAAPPPRRLNSPSPRSSAPPSRYSAPPSPRYSAPPSRYPAPSPPRSEHRSSPTPRSKDDRPHR